MELKILGGRFKGPAFCLPDHYDIRPSSVLLRRKIFDRYQHFEGYIFVDLCAGTGLVGLEALSRGAQKVIWVEKSQKHFMLLKKNLNPYLRINQDELVHDDALDWISQKMKSSLLGRPVVVFFDPPYEQHELYVKFLETMILGHEYLIWVESDRKKGPHQELWDQYSAYLIKSYSQGTRFINVYSV